MNLLQAIRTWMTAGQGVVTGMRDAASGEDPIALFDDWYKAAGKAGIVLPEAMALATSTPDGVPSSRMVLLKAAGEDGFVFYTNYGSRKATELDANPNAALLFHWAILQRQVRVEGSVSRAPDRMSDGYFASRGRGSQLGAWASEQSRPLSSRADLESRLKSFKDRFEGKPVERPPHWGGYIMRPRRIEFWQGRTDRLHDRIVFTRDGSTWTSERLYP